MMNSAVQKEIGGIPFGILMFKNLLPTDKEKRRFRIMVLTLVITYLTFLVVSISRRPLVVVQMKIIQECNLTRKQVEETKQSWCTGTVFEKDAIMKVILLSTVYIASYGIFMFFSGCIADYFNPRYYVSAGMLFTAFFSVTLGLANLWKIPTIDFFAMAIIMFGAAHSTIWPVILACTTYWYTGKRMGLFYGFWNTHSYIGGVLGIYIAGTYVNSAWGWGFLIPGFMVGVMTLFVFAFLVVHPTDLKSLDEPLKEYSRISDSTVEPPWLDSWRSLDYYEAFKVPGVVEFSGCMFFSRIPSYMFTFFLPSFLPRTRVVGTETLSSISVPYIFGGITGGIVAGWLKDRYNVSAILCIALLVLSMPTIALQLVTIYYKEYAFVNLLFKFLLGIVVEGPYILLSTSISVDLGKHGLIRRGHRGLATVASIVEGSGAMGATLGPYMHYPFLRRQQWTLLFLLLMIFELAAALCLVRMAYLEYKKMNQVSSWNQYWSKKVFMH